MDVIKSIIVTLLIIVAAYWLLRESTDDPDYVVLEYQCSKLDSYEQVPNEVTEECRKRFKK